jgi:alkylation response protein AidB-like acyl-CoA dehydrogenase
VWARALREIRDQFAEAGRSLQEKAEAARGERALPAGLWQELARRGLFRNGLEFQGQDGIEYLAAALEGLSYGIRDAGACSSVISSLGLSTYLIARHASPEARERYLRALCDGELIVATAVTEPHGGSDAQGLRTAYQQSGAGYVLEGEKWSITNTPIADLLIVFAREKDTHQPAAFLVEGRQAGVDRSLALKPSGMGTSPTGRVFLRGVVVSEQNVLGKIGEAISYLNAAFLRERLLLPFLFTGLMERILEEAVEYAHEREVFGKALAELQYTQRRLTDMKVALEVTRSLAHRALAGYMAGQDVSMEASIAKFYGANLATELVQNAMKIAGSYGVQEGELDYLLLSALCGTIGGGTEEIQRNTIYHGLYRSYRKKRTRSSAGRVTKP